MSLPVHSRLQQLRQWSGVELDPNENLVSGEKEDGQDENEQRRAAVRTISNLGRGNGGVLEALGRTVKAIRGTT